MKDKYKKPARDNMGPMDNPSLAVHKSSLVKPYNASKYASKAVSKVQIPKYPIGGIIGMFGKLLGGGAGKGLGSMFGKGAAGGGNATGSKVLNTVNDVSGALGGNKEGQKADPNKTGEQQENIMEQLPDPKAGTDGSSGGIAGKVPIYGQFVKMADGIIDKSTAALAPLTERGVRLNKYRNGTKKYEGGTPYYTGTEDRGGVVQFQRKNPLRKWDNVGKSAKLFGTAMSTASSPVDKLTGGMGTKMTNNIAGMGAAIGNTTIGDKDYGGSAGLVKVKAAPGAPKRAIPQVVDTNNLYKQEVSHTNASTQQSSNLLERSTNTANVAPISMLTTPLNKRAPNAGNVVGGVGSQEILNTELKPTAFSKGSKKIKIKPKSK